MLYVAAYDVGKRVATTYNDVVGLEFKRFGF